ncbi:MAG: helix-turn-helix domain-containing protein [Carnobacterium sp.]|uniref:helix-turn-helix domain-containing protein n=1 Tax=Carnobacterium sp. TaxID=48221 RepID=UPI003C77AC4A
MNFNEIKVIYPDAQLTSLPLENSHYISFAYENQWIQFKLKHKTKSEIELLKLIFSSNKSNVPSIASKWQHFLFNGTELPSVVLTNEFRIIQFTILKKDSYFETKTWLRAFKSMFSNTEEVFFINEFSGLLIQKKSDERLTLDEISGIIQTLDDDFSIKTIFYIGQFWPINKQFKIVFKEEQFIFEKQKNKGKNLLSLSNVALQHYTSEALEKSVLMHTLKKNYSNQPELKELILAMWHSQGNISLAAKSLYVHRNTLQYRIDRFYDTSGLSLRNMNDLLLCYLIIF